MGIERRTAVLGVAVVMSGLLVTAGCARAGRNDAAQWESGPVAVATASALPSVVESSAPPASPSPVPSSAGPSATVKPKPTPTAKKPAPVQPSKDAAKVPTEVPPPPPPPKPNCTPSYSGPNAAKQDVASALDAAAAPKQFWPTSAPTITLPKNLIYAVAWQESGWQSAILACDGGIGTMQVMPDTAKMMNNRFGTEYDVHTLDDNVMLGGEYLAWLVKYMGDVYFQGSYDLSAPAAPGSVSLLDSVIAGYNFGFGDVHPDQGEAGIPNWPYVNNVEALMTNCPCLKSS